MYKLLLYLLLIATAANTTSCITERKATNYFNDHERIAAEYCAIKFPVKEDSSFVVRIDTAGARKTQDSLIRYSDSLLTYVKKYAESRVDLVMTINRMVLEGDSTDRAIRSLQAKIASLPIVDEVALRASIEKKLRAQIKPCKDTTIYRTIENTAKVRAEQLRYIDEANSHNKTRWWKDFWMYVAAALLVANGFQYFFRKK